MYILSVRKFEYNPLIYQLGPCPNMTNYILPAAYDKCYCGQDKLNQCSESQSCVVDPTTRIGECKNPCINPAYNQSFAFKHGLWRSYNEYVFGSVTFQCFPDYYEPKSKSENFTAECINGEFSTPLKFCVEKSRKL